MEITDVRVRLINDNADRLKAFCSITFDNEFVIRDLKVVDGVTGLFVAMPSRKNSFACPSCGFKNYVRSRHCNDCGAGLPHDVPQPSENGRVKTHRDIAHPITTGFREYVQRRVLGAYQQECKLAADPNYRPRPIDDDTHEAGEVISDNETPVRATSPAPRAVREERKAQPPDLVSDYNALIANLKSGGTGRARSGGEFEGPPLPRRAQPAPQARQQQERPRPLPAPARPAAPAPPREQRGRDSGRERGPRNDRNQGSRQDRGSRPPQRVEREPVVSEQHPVVLPPLQPPPPPPAPAPRAVEPPVVAAPVFHAPPAEPRRPAFLSTPAPPPPPPPVVAVTPEVEDTDEMPFGAGIL